MFVKQRHLFYQPKYAMFPNTVLRGYTCQRTHVIANVLKQQFLINQPYYLKALHTENKTIIDINFVPSTTTSLSLIPSH